MDAKIRMKLNDDRKQNELRLVYLRHVNNILYKSEPTLHICEFVHIFETQFSQLFNNIIFERFFGARSLRFLGTTVRFLFLVFLGLINKV